MLCASVVAFQIAKDCSRLIAELTHDELELINAYKLHFSYPWLTIEVSSFIAALGMAAFAFVPILLSKGAYVEASIVGFNWFFAGPLSHKLSPLNGLKEMADSGNIIALQRLNAWATVWDKVLADNRRGTAKH